MYCCRDMVKWGASKEEQAATWTYVMLDKDKNKALDRREWKAFHQLINNSEPLRRCGRKLPRYCDVNHDTRISITEWMTCLEVTQAPQGQNSKYNLQWFLLFFTVRLDCIKNYRPCCVVMDTWCTY